VKICPKNLFFLTGYHPHEECSDSGLIIPEKTNGLHQMQWGDSFILSAHSSEVIHWNHIRNDQPVAQTLNTLGKFLVKSEAPSIKTKDGMWVKIYSGVSLDLHSMVVQYAADVY